VAVVFGEAAELFLQRSDLAGEELLDDPFLVLVGDVVEALSAAEVTGVGGVEGLEAAGVDEQAVDEAEEVVARGAGDGPVFGEGFIAGEDLLDDDEEAGRFRCGAGDAAAEAAEVGGGVVEPVEVVDAQASDLALADEAEDEGVGGLEDAGILDAYADEVVDGEEAAVVDLLGGGFPEGEPVGLIGEDPVEEGEAGGVAGPAVEDPDVFVDEGADLRVFDVEGPELLAEGLGGVAALGAFDGVAGAARREALERGREVEQGLEAGMVGAGGAGEDLEPVREDGGVGPGVEGQPGVVVLDEEAAVLEGEGELAVLEGLAVGVAEDGQDDLVGQSAAAGAPVDVEEGGVG